MGGFFGTIAVRDCVNDLFYGTDYNSHLGTKRAGLVTFDQEKGFSRKIHNLERDYFRSGTGPNKAVIGGWLNRGLWDNNTHCALPALYELKSFFDGRTGIASVMADMDDSKWYTLRGVCLDSCPAFPGIYVRNRQKVAVK